MKGLPRQRSATIDLNVQLLFKIVAFLNIAFQAKLDPNKRLAYLHCMHQEEGSTVDKLESVFRLKPNLPIKDLLNRFLRDNEADLERKDLTPFFNQMLQRSMVNIKRIDKK